MQSIIKTQGWRSTGGKVTCLVPLAEFRSWTIWPDMKFYSLLKTAPESWPSELETGFPGVKARAGPMVQKTITFGFRTAFFIESSEKAPWREERESSPWRRLVWERTQDQIQGWTLWLQRSTGHCPCQSAQGQIIVVLNSVMTLETGQPWTFTWLPKFFIYKSWKTEPNSERLGVGDSVSLMRSDWQARDGIINASHTLPAFLGPILM